MSEDGRIVLGPGEVLRLGEGEVCDRGVVFVAQSEWSAIPPKYPALFSREPDAQGPQPLLPREH